VVQLGSVPGLTNESPITIAGTTAANATVEVSGGASLASGNSNAQGGFSVPVPLKPNQTNNLSVVAIRSGVRSDAVTVTLIHDDIAPTLTVQSPSGAAFDSDGDLQVNIEFSYDAGTGSDVDLTSISATNDRDIGGGAVLGGIDAGVNVLPAEAVGPTSAAYNAVLAHEFPGGSNTLTVSVADFAGNVQTETVGFTVSGTEPNFTITQPSDGASPPADGFAIECEFSDVAGIIDEGSLTVTADNDLIGLLLQDGTQSEDVTAGENLGHLFSVGSSTAEFYVDPSYAFRSGAMTLTGHVADHAGNVSPDDAVTFTFPAIAPTLLVINSTAAPGADGHAISLGLTNLAALGGVQFTLQFDAAVLTVDSLASTGRVSFSPFYELSINGDVGELKLVLVDLGGAVIPEGSGVVLEVYASVSAAAAVQDVALAITGAEIADMNGNPVDFVVRDGVLRIR
jgi:hypothetical protein